MVPHRSRSRFVTCTLALFTAAGCGGGGGGGGGGRPAPAVVSREAVAAQYAELLHANYTDAADLAEGVLDAVDAFLADPTPDKLAAAKSAWLAARPFYQESEVGRFYNGPIDNPTDGPETRINAWPLDEGYLDYVIGNPTAGIINDPAGYPTLDEPTLAEANEKGGEANLVLGWHALEFLLWGQDLDPAGPGTRSHLDFVDAGGTAPGGNESRRRDCLRVIAQALVADLTRVRDAWAPGKPGNFRETFLALATPESLSAILTGIGTLTSGELRGERLLVPFVNKDQEDEHSCFSDNTHIDHLHDLIGVENVYLGAYRRRDGVTVSGPSLSDLVAAEDAALDTELVNLLSQARAAIVAIPEPFDQAILEPEDSEAGRRIQAAISALADLTAGLSRVAGLLQVSIRTTLP